MNQQLATISMRTKVTAFVMAMVVAALLVPGVAHAATVKSLDLMSEAGTVKALSSSGKVAWKYTSKNPEAAQIGPISAKISGDYVYIVDKYDSQSSKAKLLKKKKNTGKTVKTKVFKGLANGTIYTTKSYLYVQGADSKYLFKVKKTGLKLMWKKNAGGIGGGAAYKYKASGSKLTVWYDYPNRYESFSTLYNTKTGKLYNSAAKSAGTYKIDLQYADYTYANGVITIKGAMTKNGNEIPTQILNFTVAKNCKFFIDNGDVGQATKKIGYEWMETFGKTNSVVTIVVKDGAASQITFVA